MYLLGLGLVLLVLKSLGISSVAGWDWWLVLSPFALAVVWWAWADWSGYTKKKAMEREDQRRDERIEQNRQAMGMLNKGKKR
jgi:small Trp-rich protein